MKLAILLTTALVSVAGSACAQDSTVAHPVADSGSTAAPKAWRTPAANAAFGKQIERDLAARGARVAIVFRAGRPRSKLPPGIAYTHAAFFVYGDIKGGDGHIYQGYSVYNLYQGDGQSQPVNQSYLRQDFPFDFISADAEDDVGIVIPTPEMQRRLMATIASPAYEKMHVPSYTLVSNPWDPKHQNCTEFVLDVVASSAWQTDDYAQVKADLKAWFKPTVVQANPFERFFGPMLDSRLNLDDQSGDIETATYESISAFMADNHLSETSYILKAGG